MDPKAAVRLDRTVGRPLYALHRFLYQATGGRVGHRTRTGPILLLTTTGGRSGRPRTAPLLYYPDGNRFVVVASNGGRDQPPAWLANLRKTPEVEVHVGTERFPATAEVLPAAERARIWPALTAHYGGWAHYETLTDRELTVVALTRRS